MDGVTHKEYKLVDAFKFIFAISMVFRHTNVFVGTRIFEFVSAVFFSPSVLFFFVASGFFLGIKYNNDGSYSNFNPSRYINRLIEKLLVFEIISILITFVRYEIEGGELRVWIFKALRSIVFYPYGALWYIQAVIIATFLLWITVRKRRMNLVLPVGVALYSIALLGNNYFFIIAGTMIQSLHDLVIRYIASFRNGIFVGYYFVGTGVLLASNWDKIVDNKKRNYTLFLLSFMAYIAELFFLKNREGRDDGSLYISFLVFVPFLFVIIAQSTIKTNISTRTIRNLSTSIYLLHSPLIAICEITMILVGLEVNSSLETIIVFVELIIILLIVYTFKPKYIYKLLK